MSILWEVLRWSVYLFVGFLFLVEVVFRIGRRYVHVSTPAFATQLIDNPWRRRFVQRPELVAERMRLEPGMTVVEIGPGKGSYTLAVAYRVGPSGRVYALDIQPKVIERLTQRLVKDGIDNVIAQTGDVYDLGFPDGSIDRVFAIACLPEIPEPVKALKELHRVLRDDGVASFSELLPDPHYPLRSTLIGWADRAGFALSESFGNFFVYQLNFTKRRTYSAGPLPF